MKIKQQILQDIKNMDKKQLYDLLIEMANVNDDIIMYLNNKYTIAVTDVDEYIENISKCYDEKRNTEAAIEIYLKLRKTSVDYNAICQVGLYLLDEILFDLSSNKSKQIVYNRIKKISKKLCYDMSKAQDNYDFRVEYETLMVTSGEYAYEYMLDCYYDYFQDKVLEL